MDTHICQLCNSSELSPFEIPGMSVWQFCAKCELYQHGTVCDASVYPTDYHLDYDRKRDQKLKTAQVRLNRIAAASGVANPAMLDIGCSMGYTLEIAKAMKWEVMGVDISPEAVEMCNQKGLKAELTDELTLPFEENTFDVVTAWHVIEHVASVRTTLKEWRRVLKPNGLLVMETPDATNRKVRRLGAKYPRFWVPEHTYNFSPYSLNSFVNESGFQVVRSPFVGDLRHRSLSQSVYALLYQSYYGCRHALGMRKAFQVFAKKSGR